jgi:flagellar biosynthesis protein FlhB
MMIFAVPMASNLQTTFRGLLARSYQIPTDGPALTALAKTLALEVGAALGVPLLILCVAAFAGNILQHRIVFTTDLIMPKMSRISPLAGMGRLFSRQALANFAKGLAKLCVVGGVMAWVLWPERQKLGAIVTADPAMILPFLRTIALKLLGTVVAVLTVIAAADYFFQYGSSAKKCRRRRSRKNSARPKAIPSSKASFGSCAPPACASVSWRRCPRPR